MFFSMMFHPREDALVYIVTPRGGLSNHLSMGSGTATLKLRCLGRWHGIRHRAYTPSTVVVSALSGPLLRVPFNIENHQKIGGIGVLKSLGPAWTTHPP